MLWYGRYKNFSLNNTSYKSMTFYKLSFSLVLPYKFNFFIILNTKLNTKILFFYNILYFIKIPLFYNINSLNFDQNTSVIVINYIYINSFSRLYINSLFHMFNLFFTPFINKIKFKGKGYYIYRNYRNTITPQFGHSHRYYLYAYFINVRFLTKTKVLMFGVNKKDLLELSLILKKFRPINIFTGRGVRFSKQLIYKKAGKVSSYR